MANLGQQMWKIATRLLLGGAIATGVVGGGIRLFDFSSSGSVNQRTTASTVAADWLNIFVTASGSATLNYPATCVTNPLAGLGLGSGTVVRLTYQVGNNPSASEADIGFVKNCADHALATGSGQDLINNSCSATGCVSTYTTGTANWNGADKIKVTIKEDPTSSYTARLRLQYEDLFGE
jgi:hypothetical protein